MVDLIAQEENNKKHRGGEREEGNCNQCVQKNNSACMEMGSVRLHTVQVVPPEALSDSRSHMVNKDRNTSSPEQQRW